jgi:hypothetical protein
MSDIEPPINSAVNVAHAALLDIGRRDLADVLAVYEDDDGSLYVEPLDDLAVMDRALALAVGRG